MISKITIETDITSLMEVLNKTGNAKVATQILNGTYLEPVHYKGTVASNPDKDGNRKPYTFVSYNKWDDTISYNDEEHKNWVREMTREGWNTLSSWADHVRRVMAEEILDEMDDVVDTEQGF
jgi:hypothetical protein